MSRPKIILADTDYGYLASLELKFAEVYGNNADISVITEKAYFEKYFSTLKEADVLVISEHLYTEELKKHEISGILVLSERTENMDRKNNILWMNKFVSAKSIINKVSVLLKQKRETVQYNQTDDTTVITVCSADGGSGKTTVAMALCDSLARKHRKVLYLNTEKVQSFRCYLDQKECLGKDAYQIFWKKDGNFYQGIRSFVRNQGFDYLPPFSMMLESMQCSFDIYFKLIEEIKNSQEYDYIVVDTDHACNNGTAKLMMDSTYVIVVSRQDDMAAEKMRFLIDNLDFSQKDKNIFICNQYRTEKWNALKKLEKEREEFLISEYITYVEEEKILPLLCEDEGMKNLTYMFL